MRFLWVWSKEFSTHHHGGPAGIRKLWVRAGIKPGQWILLMVRLPWSWPSKHIVFGRKKRISGGMSQLSFSFFLELRFREDVSANLLTFIKNCLMSQLICSFSLLMAPRDSYGVTSESQVNLQIHIQIQIHSKIVKSGECLRWNAHFFKNASNV